MPSPAIPPTPARWEVGCRLEFEVSEPAHVALLVAATRSAGATVVDTLGVWVDGDPNRVEPLVVDRDDGQRTHVLDLPVGSVSVAYDAEVVRAGVSAGSAAEPEPGSESASVSVDDQLRFLRPSRYCPSDRFGGWAHREFDPLADLDPADPDQQAQLAAAVTSWVFERTDYVLGSSDGSDSAVDTLLSSQGVCRDFAHLVITICRALDLPARLAAVYAPGLSPMDFHAVAEVCVGGRWLVFDATALAPRPALLRIATGRDAADTAFVTVYRGQAELTGSTVRAATDGDLPGDPPGDRVALA